LSDWHVQLFSHDQLEQCGNKANDLVNLQQAQPSQTTDHLPLTTKQFSAPAGTIFSTFTCKIIRIKKLPYFTTMLQNTGKKEDKMKKVKKLYNKKTNNISLGLNNIIQ